MVTGAAVVAGGAAVVVTGGAAVVVTGGAAVVTGAAVVVVVSRFRNVAAFVPSVVLVQAVLT